MKIIYLLLIIGFSSQLISQSCQNMEGAWTNELGSALVIDLIQEDGTLIGHYASSTGVDGKIFPLHGWINKNADNPNEVNIAFSVRWKGYGSITSWTGYCLVQEGKPQIKTIWNLVRSGKEFDWERIITNSSTFKASDQK
jgi:hypothetical protein